MRSIDVQEAMQKLVDLHQLVLTRHNRVELTTPDGGTSVLISKTELSALEEALEILSDTDDVRAMRDELTRIAIAAGPVV